MLNISDTRWDIAVQYLTGFTLLGRHIGLKLEIMDSNNDKCEHFLKEKKIFIPQSPSELLHLYFF